MLSCGVALCLLVIGASFATAQVRSLSSAPLNLHHSSWSTRDGAPAMVLSMTQTTDGWLWLGGPTGLYRFDGMRFEQFVPANAPLLTRNVSVVNAFDDGGLWIGYRTGGAAHLQHGKIRNYSERDGLPSRAVWGVERDGAGRVWAATAQGMYYLENDRWQMPASSWAVPAGWYKTLMRDRKGILWTQGDDGVYFLLPGKTRFSKAPVSSGTGVLFNLPDGSVVSWDAGPARFNRLAGPGQEGNRPQWQRLGSPTSLLFDRRGNLWVGHKEGLEFRLANESFRSGPAQGLSGLTVGAIFEDREGNIWAATSSGIDRFRSRRLLRIDVPESAMGAAIMADDDGGAWIGGFHVSANEAGEATARPLWSLNREGWADMVTSYTRTGDGMLWGGSYGAVRSLQGEDSRRIALPAAIGNKVVTSVLAEPNGDLLAAVQQAGLYRRKRDGDWEKAGDDGEVSVMARSDASGLWLGYFPGRVVHAEGARWRSYGQRDGLAIGLVMALHLNARHVWAGGDNGLALLDAGRFKQVAGTDGETFDGISGIVELANGELWLNATAGLFRISGEEIARFKQLDGYRVHYEKLDQLDGLEGSAPRVSPSPSLITSSDSRLWIVRTTGVFRLDPSVRVPAWPAQPAIIKAIGPPGEGMRLEGDLLLDPGVSAIQADFTVASLAMPERVRFRYRLDGIDADWREAGARRSAYYSNLAPGDYIFRVAASDYNGKWSDQQTVARFTVVPTMTQTWWFKVLCGLLLLCAGSIGYRWHIKRIARQMATRLQERVQERERIARELHDTLLQSVQSLILHIHAAVVKLPAKDTMRIQLESVLQQADDVVDEGRGRIRELRGETDGNPGFAEAVLASASRLRPRDASAIQLLTSGTLRRLDGAIYQEAMAIVSEAIANAYNHACARRIEVELHYGRREFRCIVRDDGIGIPAEILRGGGRQNHWGLRGMAERAERINARLALRSSADGGTEWHLSLPGTLAYTR